MIEHKEVDKFDAVFPVSLCKRNFNSIIRKFEAKVWTRILITRNNKPVVVIADVGSA